MPPEAKVAIFEDKEYEILLAQGNLRAAGHTVVGIASTMGEAEELIPQLGELGVQVAIVDGNLTTGDGSGNDGLNIHRQIKQLFPDITTVRYSRGPLEGLDITDIKKGDVAELARRITEL